MRILVTGANGFIAREIIARLAAAGHTIVACVHNRLLMSLPHEYFFRMDFTKIPTLENWMPHLAEVDAVVNCVGVFQTARMKSIWDVHYEAPKILFDACVKANVKKIVQISALGIDKVDVAYAKSKRAIDDYLLTLPIDATVIRPGLVYGKGSYGGTSLFRGLAGFPWILPLAGRAEKLQQPIHVDDLTTIVEKSLALKGHSVLCAVGREKLSLKSVLIALREWLGFGKPWIIEIPMVFIRLGSYIGKLIPNSPLGDTGVKMMMADNTATLEEENALVSAVHFHPRGFLEGLRGMVSSVQDRWHARLYFLRPLLRLSLGFLWIYSGAVSVFFSSDQGYSLLTVAKIPEALQSVLLYASAVLDMALGIATVVNYRLLLTGGLQIICILIYTAIISLRLPALWLDPFGSVAKNIPLLAATFIMMALASER